MRIDRFLYGLIISILVAFILMAVFSSCQVLKGKYESKRDSSVTHKSDSGKVELRQVEKKDSSVYWRDIIDLIHKDTIINNVPVTNYYPTRIIREGGTQVKTEREVNYDSLWNNRLDSLSLRFAESSKSKETKVLTRWWVWLIIGLVGLAALKILLPFKIQMK